MRALAEAKGEQFDRMFVAMMSQHRQGAIEMAGLRLRSGGDLAVERLEQKLWGTNKGWKSPGCENILKP